MPLSQSSVAHERSSDRLRLTDVNSLLAELDKKRCDTILADECAALQTAEKSVGRQLERHTNSIGIGSAWPWLVATSKFSPGLAAAKDFVGDAIRVSALGRGAHAKRKQPADHLARVYLTKTVRGSSECGKSPRPP